MEKGKLLLTPESERRDGGGGWVESKAAIMADMNTPDFTFPQGQTWAVDEEKKDTPKV